jgi:hypothetical protein
LQNIAAQNNPYGSSLNACQSTHGALLLGFNLTRNNAAAARSHPTTTNPILLTVHANPILGNSSLINTGNTTPPVQLPSAAIPTAIALRRAKYVVTRAIAGGYIKPCATPEQSACAQKTCHHTVVHSAVAKAPSACRRRPAMWTARNERAPPSSARPEKKPMKKARKICTLPTQAIVEGGTGRPVAPSRRVCS